MSEVTFKVGDKVTILMGRHKGESGKIVDVVPDWKYPYEVEGFDELYGEDELMPYVDDSIEPEPFAEDTESDTESPSLDVDDYYLIVYNGADGRTLLFDPEEKLLVDEKYFDEPKENPYIQGFFDGLSHAGVKFVIKLQYIK